MEIDLLIRHRVRQQVPRSRLEKILKRLLSVLGYDEAEISLVITDDKEMASLNSTYRGKDKPTDVLSFPLLEGEGADLSHGHLGDIVISIETARRQAELYGVSEFDELTRLVIHGVLHLLGYDHENVSEEEARRMRDKEEELADILRGEE